MNLRSARPFLDMLDHVYAGVADPSRREPAMGALVKLLGAVAGSIRVDTRTDVSLHDSIGIDAQARAAYTKHWWRQDPWALGVWHAPRGLFAAGDVVCPRPRLERSAFHHTYARSYGLGELAMGVIDQSDVRVVAFGIFKPFGRRGFTPQETALGRVATSHFARAFALAEQLGRVEAHMAGADADATLMTDLGDRKPLQEALQESFKLTPAEARVAVRIGAGRSPKEVATEFGTSWNTVRSQLRAAFAKLEVASQSELTRKLTLMEVRLLRGRALSGPLPHPSG